MEIGTRYRGHASSESDLAVVRQILGAYPDASRRFISKEVCKSWDWRQANGTLKDMVCRSLLLLLELKGIIKLPPPKCKLPNPLANRKKPSMLIVLEHPAIPLHNNPAELGARKRVWKRLVSFGTRTIDGAKAWDTFMSLSATAKKLGINFYIYISDRISGAFEMPSMAELISQKAQQLNLGASWNPP
jgi:hypothetical protein